jgi:hypothetical protein
MCTGNIKIPIYDSLPQSTGVNAKDWRNVPDAGQVSWSSLTGIPVHGLPASGISRFTLNTGYSTAVCHNEYRVIDLLIDV